MGFNDSTTGYQQTVIAVAGTVKKELHYIAVCNAVDSGFTIPTTLAARLLGWVGNGCFSLGCVSGTMGPPITNMSLCSGRDTTTGGFGPLLEVSIADASDDSSDDANSKCVLVVWGY